MNLNKILNICFLFCLLTSSSLKGEIPYSLDFLLNYKQSNKGFTSVSFEDSMKRNREGTSNEFLDDKDVKSVEKNYIELCKNFHNLPRQDYNTLPEKTFIPPIIHLIWLGSAIPEKVVTCFDSWRKYHLGWEIKTWTDKEIANFHWSSEHAHQAYVEANTWAEKADILRLEVLYEYGGIYSDADVVCLNSFQDLIVQNIGFFSAFELNYIGKHYGKPFFVGSAVMGSAKNSYVMKFCLDNLKTIKEEPNVGIIKRTGPGLISRACEAILASGEEKVIILPCGFIYPLPWKNREVNSDSVLDYISLETLAIHLWDGSWCPPKKKKE